MANEDAALVLVSRMAGRARFTSWRSDQQDGAPQYLLVALGDRIQLKELSIQDETIYVNWSPRAE
jgi:hypothetical protein